MGTTEQPKYYYERTKYPKLFEHTYWGTMQDNNFFASTEVFENRNKFVEEFCIKKDRKNTGRRLPKRINEYLWEGMNNGVGLFDHTEIYEAGDTNTNNWYWVIIISPYNCYSIEHQRELDLHGFKPYKSLYRLGVSTFVKTIHNKNYKTILI